MFKRKGKDRIIILNGATGTNLLSKGLKPGESPSILNLRNPTAVFKIQKEYVDAGSNVIMTNTFSANPFNIPKRYLPKVIEEGVNIARKAAQDRAKIWGDIGPLGELIEPYGALRLIEAKEIYQSIFRVFFQKGIRDFFIETFTSITEAKTAFLCALPFARSIAVSLSLQENLHTLMGDIPESIAITFDALGASSIGVNCSEPEVVAKALGRMKSCTNKPLIAKPNAGKITIKGNKIYNSLNDRQLAHYYDVFVEAGAKMIGGCCGTTPDYIRMISQKKTKPVSVPVVKGNYLCSNRKIMNIKTKNLIVVGERLNPSGRRQLRLALKNGDYKYYNSEARKQEEAGADILDVNAYVAECDEKESIVRAVNEVGRASSLPIMLDCQNLEAAIAVMERYPGIGILNSVPARRAELKKWLPVVKKYGFKAVVSLVGKKIPRTAAERMNNVTLVLKVAAEIGFRRQDMIIDPLVFALVTESDQIPITLQAVAMLRKRQLATILGISNVSFGLPCRSLINASFVASAINAGVNFVIINPLDAQMIETINAGQALFHNHVKHYLEWAKGYEKKAKYDMTRVTKDNSSKDKPGSELSKAIVSGNIEEINVLTNRLLDSGIKPQRIIDHHITAALHTVGDNYENGQMFIPDLLRSAEAAKSALGVIRQHLPRKQAKGKVLLATVKGDIHDIGKNIAGMVFESAGYEVIDLGKDVPTKRIIDSVRKHKPAVLGLSALLTTTMPEMANVINQLRDNNLAVKVIIGGPNVSTEYAKKIGAYGAARNVLDGLRILQSMS